MWVMTPKKVIIGAVRKLAEGILGDKSVNNILKRSLFQVLPLGSCPGFPQLWSVISELSGETSPLFP